MLPLQAVEVKKPESSNARASYNDALFEKMAMRYLKGAEFIGGIYDARYKGKPLEVKSCEETVMDSHAEGGWRYGRINFWREQHDELLKTGGSYYIMVHRGRTVIKRSLVRADSMQLTEFKQVKAVSWKTVFRTRGGV